MFSFFSSVSRLVNIEFHTPLPLLLPLLLLVPLTVERSCDDDDDDDDC